VIYIVHGVVGMGEEKIEVEKRELWADGDLIIIYEVGGITINSEDVICDGGKYYLTPTAAEKFRKKQAEREQKRQMEREKQLQEQQKLKREEEEALAKAKQTNQPVLIRSWVNYFGDGDTITEVYALPNGKIIQKIEKYE